MMSLLRSLLGCAFLLLSDVQATNPLSRGDPLLMAAQSYAQTRNNDRPIPLRTLNPAIHRSDYTYRGGYQYHYQPPRISPPVLYRPFPLPPPVTYHRPSVPMPPHYHPFQRPVVPHMHHIHKGLSPPVAHRPHQKVKGPFLYKLKPPCPTKSDPTVPTTPIVPLPTLATLPEPTVLPATTAAPVTTILPLLVTTVASVETTGPVTLPVRTPAPWDMTANTYVSTEMPRITASAGMVIS